MFLQMSENKIQSNELSADPYQDKSVYPTIDIFSSPRYSNSHFNPNNQSLCFYKLKVESTNMRRLFENKMPELSNLRKFQLKDGMIHQFRQMSKEKVKIKMLICVCMYNESKHAINLTLTGIYKNLSKLAQEGISPEEVAVVLLQDGILKLVEDKGKRTYAKGEASMLHFFKDLDRLEGKKKCALQERINTILDEIDHYNAKGMDRDVANNKDFPPSIQRHISLLYQNEWKPSMTEYGQEIGQPKYIGEQKHFLKIFTCFKHLNGTKLSSHLWFFEGFCRYLTPQFIVLLDVGTKPEADGIVNLIKGFSNKDVGGVTGLMSIDSNFPSEEGDTAEESSGCLKRWFGSIEKAQEYEYIISHFLDKNTEGALGFLHVLPGAWSAYRYEALIKSEQYELDLLSRSYFKTILNPDMEEKDHRQANMYLAEDRILSLGIYCQWESKYYLRYIPNAIAKTDPMKTHEDLMKQRRRWINSSMYAFLYVWRNYHFNALESNHSNLDKHLLLNISMILGLLGFVNAYILPATYFYIIYVSIYQIDYIWVTVFLSRIVSIVFALIFTAAVAGGLTGNRWTKHAQNISKILSVFTFAMWGLVFYNVLNLYIKIGGGGIETHSFYTLTFIVLSIANLFCTIFIIFMHIFTHAEYVGKIFKDWISYTTFQGAYSITMVAHAFCNIDDISWGTKGSTAGNGAKKYQYEKVRFVSTWLFVNGMIGYLFFYLDTVVPQTGSTTSQGIVLLILGIYSTAIILVRSILAIFHHIKWMCSCCGKIETLGQPGRKQLVEKFWKENKKNYEIQVAKK